MILFAKGFWIGLCIAVPVGPIGVLCIRRSIAEGRWMGFACGAGAAMADAVYGSIAAFGLTLIANAFNAQRLWLQVLGGLFLCYLGIQTFRSEPAPTAAQVNATGYAGSFVSTFFLTLTNPMTILGFTGLFAGAGLVTEHRSWMQSLQMVLGVLLGSALWWFVLSGAASLLRQRVTPASLKRLNQLSGAIVCSFGVWQLLRSLL